MYPLDSITWSPTIVFDLHDSFAERFVDPAAVRRPTALPSVFLKPTTEDSAPKWPFKKQEVKLITVNSPAGVSVFFDLVQPVITRGHGLRKRTTTGSAYRVRLADGEYTGRVLCSEFQEFQFTLTWPPKDPPYVVPVELVPGSDYVFPDGRKLTMIRGAVVDHDGKGIKRIPVIARAQGFGEGRQCITDDSGNWVIVLDPERGQQNQDVVPNVDLEFGFDGAPVTVRRFVIQPHRTVSFRLTSLTGVVQNESGDPVSDAEIVVENQEPRSRSKNDGRWAYFFPINEPANEGVLSVKAVAGQGESELVNVNVKLHQRNRVQPLVINAG